MEIGELSSVSGFFALKPTFQDLIHNKALCKNPHYPLMFESGIKKKQKKF